MIIERQWAFWRRVQYGSVFSFFLMMFFGWIYMANFYQPANCFDNKQNGSESGVDCGGKCVRICAIDVLEPQVLWAKSFKVSGSQYNAVAYVENKNVIAASPEVRYTFFLYEKGQVIVKRSGVTVLPPNSESPIFEARIDTGGRVPDKTELVIEPPELWQPAVDTRKQFRVVNRQLFDADGRPRLEATIENTELFESKNVEVVATLFDTSHNPLTVSRTFVDNFAPRSTEKVTFTWPEPIAKTVRSCEVPTDVVLAIDLSGSMNNDGGNPPEPITSVLKAAETFATRLQSGDQAALVTFASKAVLNSQLSSGISAVAQMISGLTISPAEERGSTNTGDAIKAANNELISGRHNPNSRKVLVILTDGLATAPGDNPESYAKAAADKAKADGVIVYAIGLGDQVNMDFVRSLASSKAQAYQAISNGDVDKIYTTITGDICEDGAAIIDIVTKTSDGFTPLR